MLAAMTSADDSDRDAILARRQRFVARALEGFGGSTPRAAKAGRRTKAVALSLSGLTTACPCLKVAEPQETTEEESAGDGDPGATAGTAGDTDATTGANAAPGAVEP